MTVPAAHSDASLPGAESRILLFGGSFDPIHNGHLISAISVAEKIQAASILLIPSGRPPHKLDRRLASGAERLEMCRRAVEGDSRFDVSDWELQQPGPNYTFLTVRHYRAAMPSAALYWLIGQDSLLELPTWYCAAELADMCTLVTAARPGYASPDWSRLRANFSASQIERLAAHVFETPQIEIDATALRRRVAGGKSIRYFVPRAVEQYIQTEGLYR